MFNTSAYDQLDIQTAIAGYSTFSATCGFLCYLVNYLSMNIDQVTL